MRGWIVILIFVVLMGVSFLITSGLISVICLCLGLAFSWKIALAVWCGLLILSAFLKGNK